MSQWRCKRRGSNRGRWAIAFVACVVATVAIAAGCGEDEPLADQICLEIDTAATARGNPGCTDAKCMVKRTRQRFTAALCAASKEDAETLARYDRNWLTVAENEVARSCRAFTCPDPNPCTLAGRNCNVQPVRAHFEGRGEPACLETGEDKGCDEGERMWHCTRVGDVEGGRVCGCLDASA